VLNNPNKPEPCITIETPAAVKKCIIDKMVEGAWDMVDFTDAAQVYIVDSADNEDGYNTIKKWLEINIDLQKFKRIPYGSANDAIYLRMHFIGSE
jgi:hypothetical protein